LANCQPTNNCFGKSWAALNLAFVSSDASFSQKKEARIPMLIFKYFAVVGSALFVFLFVSGAYFGDENNSRFNGSLYESAVYAPRLEETVVTAELRFTRDVTPADRVKEVFGQFVPNEGKRGSLDRGQHDR
jgi:hypothetical protein